MSHSRALFASLLATVCVLACSIADAQVGIEPVADQTIPSGKTLVVPIPASDPGGPARTYTVKVGKPTLSGTTTPAFNAGINAVIRTGDPHLFMGVSYSDSNQITMTSTTAIITTGTMEFQLLREYAPQTTKIISGLAEGGFYNPVTVNGTTTYVTFGRIATDYGIVQAGENSGNGTGGPGFSFPDEYNRALMFSGSGQLAMANAGNGAGNDENGTDGSEIFITVNPYRGFDFRYSIFGQLLRGMDTLEGIYTTPATGDGETSVPNTPVNITSATVASNNTDAVLLLSATGVCDAQITITATTIGGGAVTTATTGFTAHAVADTTNDPSFIQPSPPDITAPNGSVKVAISAIDLQLELVAYGYDRLLPAPDTTVTTGTSPILNLPLVSNTDNAIAAAVIQWPQKSSITNGSIRLFHVGAGAYPISGALAAIPAGSGFLDLKSTPPLAVIADINPQVTGSTITATVIWGDGSPVLSSTNAGVVVKSIGGGRYDLIAPHDYTSPGEYPIIVRVSDPNGARLTLTGTANVGPSAIAMTAYDVASPSGVLRSQFLATFQDNGLTSTGTDYTTLINWGDGSITNGTLRAIGHSSYQVFGTHTYTLPDSYTIGATVTRTGTYSATTWTTATVTGSTPIYPPFAQIHLAQMWTSPLYTDSNNFLTTGSSGGSPFAGLVQGSDGNFYGTTTYGGTNGYGTVYQLTSGGAYNTLYAFTGGIDGGDPYGPLIENGTTGTFYGTTFLGGANNGGTIYTITSSGSFNTLYAFNPATDGGNPQAGLVADGTSAFYGTTTTGGQQGSGTVFSVTLQGSYSPLYSFSGGSDGGDPAGGVITGTDGELYGTTESGGANGFGTVFKLSTAGSLQTLHTFASGTDGATPAAGLAQGIDDNFYGTTTAGGASGDGTIFSLSYSGSYNQVYAFTGASDGATPYAPVLAGTDGNLYGATRDGGIGYGTVYNLTYSGSTNFIYDFSNGSDGGHAYAPVIEGTDGSFYGTTETGGANGYGVIYQFTMTSGSTGTETPLFSFGSGSATQFSLRGGVNIVNSGNKPLLTGSGTFSVYVDPSGTLDGNQTILSLNGQTVFPIPTLKPGQAWPFAFRLDGSFSDTRLKLPLNFDPHGQQIIGVVTYHDPVGDFDGASKIVSPGTFSQ
jgi:uncharacterized repeat protein (TIGR03803 family)